MTVKVGKIDDRRRNDKKEGCYKKEWNLPRMKGLKKEGMKIVTVLLTCHLLKLCYDFAIFLFLIEMQKYNNVFSFLVLTQCTHEHRGK